MTFTSHRSLHVPTPVGTMLLVADDDALLYAQFIDCHVVAPPFPTQPHAAHPILAQATRELERYFAHACKNFDVPLAPAGTAFQQRVWRALARIPHGGTICYGELARNIDAPRAVRAVGAAIGRNPLCVFVPCHRVVGADGSLTGYAGGLERKLSLLVLESMPCVRAAA